MVAAARCANSEPKHKEIMSLKFRQSQYCTELQYTVADGELRPCGVLFKLLCASITTSGVAQEALWRPSRAGLELAIEIGLVSGITA